MCFKYVQCRLVIGVCNVLLTMCVLLGCTHVLFVMYMFVFACVLAVFVMLCGFVWLFADVVVNGWLLTGQWVCVVVVVVVVVAVVVCVSSVCVLFGMCLLVCKVCCLWLKFVCLCILLCVCV